MDHRKWFPTMPLFGACGCVYCSGVADTTDHTPPRCLLPKRLPNRLQLMTVPACSICNGKFSADEMRTAAVVSTVSFTEADQAAVRDGGWINAAMNRDASLRKFVDTRLSDDGIFHPDGVVLDTIARVMVKTTAGLLFHEFGRVVPLQKISVLAIDHTKNVPATALAENYRRDDTGWAEITPSGRELERHVLALYGHEPPNMPKWHVYLPKFFEYMFVRRSSWKLLVALKIHDAVTVLLEAPWPSTFGPRRAKRRHRCAGCHASSREGEACFTLSR